MRPCAACGDPTEIPTESGQWICTICSEIHCRLVISAATHQVSDETLAAWILNPACELCGVALNTHRHTPTQPRFNIDHDHRHCPGSRGCDDCVRGLLCQPCNTRLGMWEAMVDTFGAARLNEYAGKRRISF